MANVFDTLKERGFIAQCTNEAELRELFDKERVTFYIGFDPTADSLHAGHFIALMAMAHMQRAGHRPICLVGGGTGTVGDPSGRTDMRKMLTDEDIEHNCECFKKQIARFIDFSDGKAIMVNNGDWLRKLNYIDLLRDVGACFTVNRMLAAECYKQRWEKGLTFLEFNYMVMQAYDFLELNRRYGCKLEMGGDDQWSNIIAGVELNRRKNNTAVYGLTNKLLTKSDGKKMGKTAGGALWLDAEKTSPYEFYQYWRNVDDADVEKCLSLLTFLPMEEVHRL
ncbi:tyrosine--tRNA ligase, partial [Mitsuokella sp.]|uniref:tyrosine--tRNA ligase n=1 Tax=Mitsuokella sp. TaxID=2049034 RepID=UPI002A825805